jgi:hypothetical protein
MAPFFWAIATSDLAFWIGALILLASAVVGWFPLLRWFPVLGAYVPLARAVFVVMLFLIGVCLGHRLADESAALKQAQQDLAFSRLQLDAQRQSADTANKLRVDAEAKAATANQKVTDYEERLSKLPESCGCALDDDDVNSLRNIAR